MAVDALSFVARGVYDVAGTAQSVVNARFASWGMLGVGGTGGGSAVFRVSRIPSVPIMPTFPSMACGFLLFILVSGGWR